MWREEQNPDLFVWFKQNEKKCIYIARAHPWTNVNSHLCNRIYSYYHLWTISLQIKSYYHWFLNRYHLCNVFLLFKSKRRLLRMRNDGFSMCVWKCLFPSILFSPYTCIDFLSSSHLQSIDRFKTNDQKKKKNITKRNANAYIIKACWQMNFLACEQKKVRHYIRYTQQKYTYDR